jgi:hypothetical protein
MQYTMTCKCGDNMTVEAETREEAVGKFKVMMDENGIKTHMDSKHPGEPLMSVADCHAMIERDVQAVS